MPKQPKITSWLANEPELWYREDWIFSAARRDVLWATADASQRHLSTPDGTSDCTQGAGVCQNNRTGKYNAFRKGAEDPEVMFKVFYVIIKVKKRKKCTGCDLAVCGNDCNWMTRPSRGVWRCHTCRQNTGDVHSTANCSDSTVWSHMTVFRVRDRFCEMSNFFRIFWNSLRRSFMNQ